MDDKGTLVRIGVVSNVNEADKTAQVYYPDMSNMVSGWLQVLQHPQPYTTSDGNHTHPGCYGGSAGTHRHTVQPWMPKINDKVLVLMQQGFNSNGFILGVIP